MIAYLVGQPLVTKNSLIMLVNGVGYGVQVTTKTLAEVRGQSETALHVYTHVREDAFELFGFKEAADKELFELLLSVSGVGPRTALALTELGSQRLITAVQTADITVFSAVPRVGKKVAQKIIIELKPKLGSIQDLYLGSGNPQEQDVVDALQALGFAESEIHRVRPLLDWSGQLATPALIKQAIQKLGTKSQ
jgi:Holliday junction DNA helicase RuvA